MRRTLPCRCDDASRLDDLTSDERSAWRRRFEKLSIFYPMWNEEEYIERALVAGRRACAAVSSPRGDIGDYELIVVDDASTDRHR